MTAPAMARLHPLLRLLPRSVVLLPLLSLPLLLRLLLPLLPSPTPRTFITTDRTTNITLRISGSCRTPFTYLGTDSRPQLLRFYDLSASPLGSYNPATLNWARVALLKQAFRRCPHVSYFVYSDTDAYLTTRRRLTRRLDALRPVVYQQGMWTLNSGFSSWRNNKPALKVLSDWSSRYTPSDDFYAEQRAMLHTVGNLSWAASRMHNGFLGWHIKGSRPYKVEVADLGRRLCYYEPYIVAAVLLPVVVTAAVGLFLTLRLRFTGSARGVRPFIQLGVVVGRCLRNDVLALLSAVPLLALLLCKTDVLGEWHLRAVERLSKQNFTHVIPGGRVMVNGSMLCSRWWCVIPQKGSLGYWVHALLQEITKSRLLSLGIFFFYGVASIVLPCLLVACLCAVCGFAVVSLVCGAVNLGNVFVLHDVADGTFGRRSRILGKWTLRAVAPRAGSGVLEVVKLHDGL